jgi:hypothetical protein
MVYMMCDINFQPKMDVIKEELESHSLSSHSEGERITDIKHEVDPVPEPFCIVKTEAYVSHYPLSFVLLNFSVSVWASCVLRRKDNSCVLSSKFQYHMASFTGNLKPA